jgi:hypothetical protein
MSITEWRGVEMAIRDVGPDGVPQFSDPPVPFLQLLSLRLALGSRDAVIHTYQSDAGFGLAIDRAPDPPVAATAWDGIYREGLLRELPTGLVTSVDVVIGDAGDIDEVVLVVGERTVLLMAGEVDEQGDGALHFRRHDESVLVFGAPTYAEGLHWFPPRN